MTVLLQSTYVAVKIIPKFEFIYNNGLFNLNQEPQRRMSISILHNKFNEIYSITVLAKHCY